MLCINIYVLRFSISAGGTCLLKGSLLGRSNGSAQSQENQDGNFSRLKSFCHLLFCRSNLVKVTSYEVGSRESFRTELMVMCF